MHLIVALGILVMGAAIASIVFRLAKQSTIIAFIVVGIVAGLFREQIHIPEEVADIFTELGILLLLFMAGLEVEFESIKKRWRLLLSFGLGQIALTTTLGMLLAYFALDLRGVTALIYFGLCLTFSSTIVVLGYLKSKKEMESFHGQITLGLMVLQDVTAVLALVVLTSLSGEGSLVVSIGIVLLKMIALAGLLYLCSRTILRRVFRYLAKEKELLFLGALGWPLGIAALCEAVHFSPEIGAFMAGASLAILPYRLEIQDKVEPMKDFGVLLFFVILGYGLQLDGSALPLLWPAAIAAAYVVFVTPLFMLLIAFLTKTKSRPSFMIGGIINQISEFSLILATLCLQAGLFTPDVFLVITLATLITLVISGLGHQFLEHIHAAIRGPLSVIDRRSAHTAADLHGFELEDHVVVVEYNELGEKVVDYYLRAGHHVLLIELDPDAVEAFGKRHERLRCVYADIFDPDVWEEMGLGHASMIVSCMVEGQSAELGILRWLKEGKHEVPFMAATDNHREAAELYEAGAAYVIQTEQLAAEQFGRLLEECGPSVPALRERGVKHREVLTGELAAAGARWF